MRKVVPKSLRKSLEGIEGPSSFWDWDRVSLSPFVNSVDRNGCLQAEDRRPKTEDRFSHLKLQNEDLRQNALLDAKTLNSMGSSFCSFTHLKLQNEDRL